jgi:hypothetical protein
MVIQFICRGNAFRSLLDRSDVVIFLNNIAYEEAVAAHKLPQEIYIWDVTDLGEAGRIPTTEAEREAYSEEVYEEIIKNVDDLLRLKDLYGK